MLLTAMIITGNWVADRFEEGVLRSAGTLRSSQLKNIFYPVRQDIASFGEISPPARQAMAEILSGSAFADRILSYEISLEPSQFLDASVLYSEPERVDDANLVRAWRGETIVNIAQVSARDATREALPVIDVYSPVLQAWSGEVIAVIRFQEYAEEVLDAISEARLQAWIVVGNGFLLSGILLSIIVSASGMTIRKQNAARRRQLSETRRLLKINEDLRLKMIDFAARDGAATDSMLREVGYELHDGPAQLIAFARMRLMGAVNKGAGSSEAKSVEGALADALTDIRRISRGLSVPDLLETPLPALVRRVCADTTSLAGLSISIDCPDKVDATLDYAMKLCTYRFLQETLANVVKHADVTTCEVAVRETATAVIIEVRDQGVGFAGLESRQLRRDGGQGLFSLAERAENIGGSFEVESVPGEGSLFRLILNKAS